jgi:hypothetical protein
VFIQGAERYSQHLGGLCLGIGDYWVREQALQFWCGLFYAAIALGEPGLWEELDLSWLTRLQEELMSRPKTVMMKLVMSSAKPDDTQRLAVVWMMRLAVWFAA